MKQYKNKLQGTGSVFRFTLQQFFKNKANMISLLIVLLVSTLVTPITTLLSGAESKEVEIANISRVFVANSTPYTITDEDFTEAVSENSYWANTTFCELSDVLPNPGVYSLAEDEVEVRFMASEDQTGYTINITTCDAETVSEDSLEALEALSTELFEIARYKSLNVSDEQLAILMASWRYDTDSIDGYLEDDNKWGTQYMLQYAYSFVLMMVCTLSVSYIVRSVIEEKASKLVETLMVSIQPLALIVGKVLASMAYVLIFMGAMLGGYVLSFYITGIFLEVGSLGDTLGNMGISLDLMNFTPISIIAFVVSLLLGYLTFSLIAGLSASGCSNMEESEGATLGATFLIIFGYIIACAAGATSAPVAVYISSLVPFVSIFCAPVHYLMGNIGLGALILAWVLQIVVVIALAVLCGKIYRSLIMHRGTRITWKQMLVMFRQNTTAN
ncbi:MAG: ABC transporter permease [Lachnospiraceae bacterium]|nr:ABC transporter permease [Lachnospiraceae bacterium]